MYVLVLYCTVLYCMYVCMYGSPMLMPKIYKTRQFKHQPDQVLHEDFQRHVVGDDNLGAGSEKKISRIHKRPFCGYIPLHSRPYRW